MWIWTDVENTLACYDTAQITTVKILIAQASGVCTIKPFTSVIMCHTKLECLLLSVTFTLFQYFHAHDIYSNPLAVLTKWLGFACFAATIQTMS